MDEWFKARLIWLGAVMKMSDEDAGRFCKALFTRAATGEMPDVDGVAGAVLAMADMQLSMDEQSRASTSEKRSESGKKGGRPKTNCLDEKAKKANAFDEKQTEAKKAIADNKNKNKSKNIEQEEDKENIITSPNGEVEKRKRFTPPSVEDVKAYCTEKGYKVDADRFVDFYASKGWMVGRNPMKDWQAAVRNWANAESPAYSPPAPAPIVRKKVVGDQQFQQREYEEKTDLDLALDFMGGG